MGFFESFLDGTILNMELGMMGLIITPFYVIWLIMQTFLGRLIPSN